MAKSLKLTNDPLEGDLQRVEICRRVVCNIVFLDRILSPSFNMQCYFSLDEAFKEPATQEELQRTGSVQQFTPYQRESLGPNLVAEIFRLSHLFCRLCLYHRKGDHAELGVYEREHLAWQQHLNGDLPYSFESLNRYRQTGSVRQFLFLHLLHHHIGQLLYFPALRAGSQSFPNPDRDQARIDLCQFHASRISEIVKDGWNIGGIEVHNTCYGQILTISAAIHVYSCLTASSSEYKEAARANISAIIDSFVRIRKHCRIFDRMVGV